MAKKPPSIFNDVIGPVMRGPSSSHTAASQRIGKLAVQLLHGNLKKAIIEFDPKGSLATTYRGHGSDIGLAGGFLGWDLIDSRLVHSLDMATKQGIDISFKVTDFKALHPNTYKMTLFSDKKEEVQLFALSTGGGMIEIKKIEGIPVSISGDYYETLIFFRDTNEKEIKNIINEIKRLIPNIDYCDYSIKNKKAIIDVKMHNIPGPSIILKLKGLNKITSIKQLNPILPVLSWKNCKIPFTSSYEMLKKYKDKDLRLWELAVLYESERGNLSKDEVFSKMKEIVLIMKGSILNGLKGTSFKNRILGPQAWMIKRSESEGKLIPGEILNTVTAWTMSMMEVKSSMGVIVAAPTAGSCGTLPGTILGIADEMGLDDDESTKAMLAAGIIGIFIAEHATFAAEIGGCQAECGAASGMAAAGVVQLAGGAVEQGINAASIALQNIMGIICDPVANRVEVPCLGKNVMGATNAISSANMVLAGVDPVIPLDEVIESMYKTGKMLPSELRCTGYGGLSITKTAKRIEKKLNL